MESKRELCQSCPPTSGLLAFMPLKHTMLNRLQRYQQGFSSHVPCCSHLRTGPLTAGVEPRNVHQLQPSNPGKSA